MVKFSLVVLLCVSGWSSVSAGPEDLRSAAVESLMVAWIAEAANEDSVAAYRLLSGDDRIGFLDRFWESHNSLIHTYYVGHHLGRRRYTVSDDYFERMTLVPELFKLHAGRPDAENVLQARSMLNALVEAQSEDAVARCALGYVLLEAGAHVEADEHFLEALKIDRKFAEARNGRGLALLAQGKLGTKALEAFRSAELQDKAYAAAAYNTAMGHLVIRSREVHRWFEQVVEKFPDHPDAYFKMGAYHESGLILEKEPDLARAAEAYEAQVRVNPDHGKAWFQLGSVLLQTGRAEDAIAMWERLMQERPGFRERYLTLLIEAYQKAGYAQKAEETANEYIAGLDDSTRTLFKDLTLIATPSEQAEFEALDRWDKLSFARKFWVKRDPSPATEANERRVEHYRRIIYAMQHFSDVRKPWDRRGEVYIRYGEPQHKSRWDDMRFEFHPDVIKVKNRLQDQLPQAARREIISRSRRIRQSIRDRSAETGEVGDFEGVEFELNAMRRSPERSGNRREGEEYYENSFTSIEKMGVPDIRGLPLFPVDPSRPWEYWIYPYIGDGIEVVFESLTLAGDFDFPGPPQDGRAESSKNTAVWMQKQPENVLASAVSKKGETYLPEAPSIRFLAESADFMGDGKSSRFELYFGIPLSGLATALPDTGVLSRGLVVFSTDWKPLFRKTDAIRYLYDPERPGQIAVSEAALSLPPGDYVIGTQFKDEGGQAFGARYDTVSVDAYTRGNFAISDIELASEIFEDYQEALKGGLGVIPNPTRLYLNTRPVLIYYEVYGLAKDEFGQTRYGVDYTVKPADPEGKFVTQVLRSLGKVLRTDQKETVTISTEQTGYRTEQSEFLGLDVTNSKEGRYDLVVTVTDSVAQVSATKQTSFELRESDD